MNENEEERLKELFESGISNVKIGEILGYHNTTVGRKLKKMGLSRDTKKHIKYHNCVICDKEIKNNKKNRSLCGACNIRVRRYRIKKKVIKYLGGCCSKCGYNKAMSALQFHHINPKEKDFIIGANSNKSWLVIKKELDKCILLCANCHSEEHSKQNDENLLHYVEKH